MGDEAVQQWTLGELADRVAFALAASNVRVPNGRVTPLPDGRVIRWYATIGLVDRPTAMRGRTALYGPRHLLQLVAVKRRQAQGFALADIQAELTGATDATLRRIAGTSAGRPDAGRPEAGAMPAAPLRGDQDENGTDDLAGRERFWTATPTVRRDVPLSGVRLAGGVVLLLPATPDAADIADIESAARPLLDLLAKRGLLTTEGERRDDDR